MFSFLSKSFAQPSSDAEIIETVLNQGKLYIHQSSTWFHGTCYQPCLAVPPTDLQDRKVVMLGNRPNVSKVKTKSLLLSFNGIEASARNALVKEIQATYQYEDPRYLNMVFETPWVKLGGVDSFSSVTEMLCFALSNETSQNVMDSILSREVDIRWEYRDIQNNTLLHLAIMKFNNAVNIIQIMNCVYRTAPDFINQRNAATIRPLELSIRLDKLNSNLLESFINNGARIFSSKQDGSYSILLDRFEVGVFHSELVVASKSFNRSKCRIYSPILSPNSCQMLQSLEFQTILRTKFTLDCQSKVFTFPCPQLISYLIQNKILIHLHIAARYSCGVNRPYLFNQPSVLNIIDKNRNNLLHSALLSADLGNFRTILALCRDSDSKIDLLTMQNADGVAPIHVLIQNHEWDMIKNFLLYKTVYNDNLCHIAMAKNDPLLLEAVIEEVGSLDICNELNIQSESPLIVGIKKQSTESILRLLGKEHNCRLEQKDRHGRNCLHISIMNYQEDVFCLLLSAVIDYGASTQFDILNCKHNGMTPFLLSLKEHVSDAAIKLVQAGAVVPRGQELFPHLVRYYDNSLISEELIAIPLTPQNLGNELDNHCKVTSILYIRDSEENTLLHYSLKSRRLIVFQKVLKQTPLDVISALDRGGNHVLLTALKLELVDQSDEIIDEAIKYIESPLYNTFINQKNTDGECPVFIAILKGYISIIIRLIKLRASFEITDERNNNIFHILLKQKSSLIVFRFFRLFIKDTGLHHLLTRTNDLNENLLHLMINNGHINIVSLLIKEGLLDKFKGPDGSTLLHCAVICDSSTKQEAMISEILKHENILDAVDSSGQTALFYAIIRSKLPIVNLLLEKSPDLSINDKSGLSVLHYAISGFDCLILRTLLAAFARSKLIDFSSLILYCIKQGNLFGLKEMLAINPVMDLKDSRGRTLLHHVAKCDDRPKTLLILINHINKSSNLDVYASRDNEGKTPLHVAIEHSNFNSFKLMFHSFLHLSVRDNEGNTVLHLAVINCNLEIVDDLLKLLWSFLKRKIYSFIRMQNLRKLSALHLAIKLKKSYTVQCLINAGAELMSTNETGDISISGGSEDLALHIYSSLPSTFGTNTRKRSNIYVGYSINSSDSLFLVSKLPDLRGTEVKDNREIVPISCIADNCLRLLLKCASTEPLRFAIDNKLIDPTRDIFKEGNISEITSEEISCQVSELLIETITSGISQYLKSHSNLATAITGPIEYLDSQLKLLTNLDQLNPSNEEQVNNLKNYVIGKAVLSSLDNSTPEALGVFLSYDLMKLDYHYSLHHNSLLHCIIERDKPVDFMHCLMKYVQKLEINCPEETMNGDRFINATDHNGMTAVHNCIKNKQIAKLKALLDYSPDVTKPDLKGNTPLHLAVSTLSVEILELMMKYILKQPDPRGILYQKNSDGITPLHLALNLANLSVLKCLISNKCSPYLIDLCFRHRNIDLNTMVKAGVRLDLSDSRGNTMLHLAARYSDDIDALKNILVAVKQGKCMYDLCSLLSKTTNNGLTSLHVAIKYDNYLAMRKLVHAGAQLRFNAKCGKNNITRLELMRKLQFIRIGANPEFLYIGYVLDSYCIVTDLPEMKKTELVKHTSVDILNQLSNLNILSICYCEFSIPLDLAIDKKLVLEHAQLSESISLSILISRTSSLDVVKLFLTKFNSRSIYNGSKSGLSMIESAVYNPNLDVLEWLLGKLGHRRRNTLVNHYLSRCLRLSIERGLIHTFELLLDNQADIHSTHGIDCDTLLHLMVQYISCNRFISCLLERINLIEKDKPNELRFIDSQNSNLRTALHASIYMRLEQMVETLLSWSPDLSITDAHGNNVFHLAAQTSQIDIVRMLITALKKTPDYAKSPLDSPNKMGCRPLHLAVLTGNILIVELLLETLSSYSTTRDRFGGTFLHYAVCSKVRANRLGMVKRLVEMDRSLYSEKRMLDTYDSRGNTPLLLAEALEQQDIVGYIRMLSYKVDGSKIKPLHSDPNTFSSRLVRILADQTDVGSMPREISEDICIKSPFLSTPNSLTSITGCYWCADSSNTLHGLVCCPSCYFLLHSWCLGKVELFCGVKMCGLPGCNSEVLDSNSECCWRAHLEELLAIRRIDVINIDSKCQLVLGPKWYTETTPIQFSSKNKSLFVEFTDEFPSYVILDGETWRSVEHFLNSHPKLVTENQSQILFRAMLAKFEQNSNLRDLLVRTGSRKLISEDQGGSGDVLMRVRDNLK